MVVDLQEVAEETVTQILSAFDVPRLEIRYELPLDLGTRIGEAVRHGSSRFSVRLNPNLFLRLTPAEAVETLQHEIAHCYDYAIVRQWGHGPSWRMLMVMLGYPEPNPCHSALTTSFEVKRERVPAWCISCGKHTGVTLTEKTRLRHGRPIKRVCCHCGSRLTAKAERVITGD